MEEVGGRQVVRRCSYGVVDGEMEREDLEEGQVDEVG